MARPINSKNLVYVVMHKTESSLETHSQWTIWGVWTSKLKCEVAMKKLQKETPPEEYAKYTLEVFPPNAINPINLHV